MSSKDAILHRMKLYDSLKRRGLMSDDSVLKGVDGSLFDSMYNYVKNESYSFLPPETISQMANDWFEVASLIYDDPSIPIPDGWGKLLESIKKIAMYPESHQSWMYLIKDALDMFPTELMAVDMPDRSSDMGIF